MDERIKQHVLQITRRGVHPTEIDIRNINVKNANWKWFIKSFVRKVSIGNAKSARKTTIIFDWQVESVGCGLNPCLGETFPASKTLTVSQELPMFLWNKDLEAGNASPRQGIESTTCGFSPNAIPFEIPGPTFSTLSFLILALTKWMALLVKLIFEMLPVHGQQHSLLTD